jgi:5-methylcytosine-specific restriction endonuclease McrA
VTTHTDGTLAGPTQRPAGGLVRCQSHMGSLASRHHPRLALWLVRHTSTNYQKEIILPFRPKQFKPPQWRPPPVKVADPYYASTSWRTLRTKRLAMDNHTCVVEGCGQRAIVADHIVARHAGGADSIGNLRSLCRTCDNQARERSDGTRRVPGNDFAKWL